MIIFVGLVTIVITILIHGSGTTLWLRFLVRHQVDANGLLLPNRRFVLLACTAVLMILLHLLEVMLWALVYRLVAPAELPDWETATYFSVVTFTSLGYGDITLSSQWRLLSGLQAIDGIVLLGWTTAFLFAVLQRSWAVIHTHSK